MDKVRNKGPNKIRRACKMKKCTGVAREVEEEAVEEVGVEEVGVAEPQEDIAEPGEVDEPVQEEQI